MQTAEKTPEVLDLYDQLKALESAMLDSFMETCCIAEVLHDRGEDIEAIVCPFKPWVLKVVRKELNIETIHALWPNLDGK